MKLRKLILSGFKSFAKRTEFDFHDGVSCVVGPNGCGKSNIVDAIKWVLGERSAKSLRGEEMADVIFNGSAARAASGMAEVTLVFENDRGVLKPEVGVADATDGMVSVGRRLYRSGQSEYLINNTSCRLKDVRELFMDTGVGVEAYSLIEQGKVEVFLQSTQDERRGIFDEAAGISKYKARRKETERRLERIEQNLLRLSDILAEVEKRLRSIKYQAGKARNHQAYTERLKELRSLYLLAQYHLFSRQRTDLQRAVDEGSDGLASAGARIDKLESARSAAEVEAVDLERAGREMDAKIATVGGQIATCEERIGMLTARVKELGDQIVTVSARCEALEAKAAEQDEQIRSRGAELQEVEERSARLGRDYQAASGEHASAQQAVTALQRKVEDAKAVAIDLMRQAAQVHNELSALAARRESLEARRVRLEQRSGEVDESLRRLGDERAEAQAKLGVVKESIAAGEARLTGAREAEHRLSESESALLHELSDCREKRSAVESRIGALREMLARLEGVGSGTKRVVEALRAGRLKTIRGMLADFIETDVEHAQVVEAALAGWDELLIADPSVDAATAAAELAEALGGSGSVEVLCPSGMGGLRSDLDASACQAVGGRVMDHVTVQAEMAPVVWRLLGRTFVTATLADALAAAATLPDARFVTAAGEVLEADGRVRLGCARRSAGIVSRRSELAELQRQLQSLSAGIDKLQAEHASKRTEIQQIQALEQRLRTAIYEANTERVETEGVLKRLESQAGDQTAELRAVQADLRGVLEDIEGAAAKETEARGKAERIEQQKAECERSVQGLNEQIAQADRRREEIAARMMELKVAQAGVEEKKIALREAVLALRRQQEQRLRDVEAGRAEMHLNRQRREDAEASIAKARQEMEGLYGRQQQLSREAEETEESRKGLQQRLEEIRAQLAERRKEQEQLAAQVGARRVELGEVDVRIEDLITRAGDEMGMNLLELYAGYTHDDNRDWDAVKAEIQDLNDKIGRLGNVNLDAISEQEELEKRREFLTAQLDDIKNSRNQLHELIRRINKESRERFMETFEAARKNFHELFRKLFNGGRADIILLNPDDVLESGIEIVARPPGKELRSLSLLSGGEKTMTALALLFSIFKTRPSPFCLLDEVDAALDEANTERFGKLVQEFMAHSQFVIISHAKRTMSMANVLYGVTMQEPGVSTRISVRFEDVGHKLDAQLEPVEA